MNVYHNVSEVPRRPRFVAVGTFDGVHRGHQRIICELVEQSRQEAAESMVVTFDPHPRQVVGPGAPDLLTGMSVRLSVFEELGVDSVLVITFDRAFAQRSPSAFVHEVLVDGLGALRVFVGFNFRFGHDARGDVTLLQRLGAEQGFAVRAFEPLRVGDTVVSSTKIRELLAEGQVQEAALLLGRPYRLRGKVESGDGRGRTLGFPTANLAVSGDCLRPATGVYAGYVTYGPGTNREQLLAVVNIGCQPTFAQTGDRRPLRLEVHILDFDDDLYGLLLDVGFLARLRDERRFKGVEQLRCQLERDVAHTRDLFGANSSTGMAQRIL